MGADVVVNSLVNHYIFVIPALNRRKKPVKTQGFRQKRR